MATRNNIDGSSLIELANGDSVSIDALSADELHNLQWDQEQAFAHAILHAPRLSQERQSVIAAAYDLVGAIMSARAQRAGGAAQQVNLGSNAAYLGLVLNLLRRQKLHREPAMFEVGFGSGSLLAQVAREGILIGGSRFLRSFEIKLCKL